MPEHLNAPIAGRRQNFNFFTTRLGWSWPGTTTMLLFFFTIAPVHAQGRRALPGSVPPAAFRRAATSALPATQTLRLAICLPLNNQDKLTATLQDLYDPASPNYHQWLTSEQFVEAFGPTAEDVQRVTAFAAKYGLTVETIYSNKVVVDVSGPVRNIERAFQVRMMLRPHPTEKRNYFAPDVEPSVEAGVPVLAVEGLDNFATIRSNYHLKTNTVISNATGSSPGGGYMGNDLRNAYAPGVTLDGTGQNIGLFEFSTTCYAEDFQAYTAQAGIAPVNISYVLLNGVSPIPSGDTGEQCLDVEVAHAMAPGANIIYYAGNNSIDIFNRIASDNICKSASCSFGVSPPPAALSVTLQQMAAQGQSMFNASGDSGFQSTGFGWDDNPYMTQVGGTVLTTSSPGGPWSAETGWGGSGSTISTAFTIPTWQQGIDMTAAGGSTTMRNVPDVAMVSDSLFFVWHPGSNQASGLIGGTSASSPEWAGFMALVNQQATTIGNPTAGFINPAVYAILKGTGTGTYANCFHDITTGSNGKPAVAGYDLVTGVGTPKGQPLIDALAGTSLGANFFLAITPPAITVRQNYSSTNLITVLAGNGFGGNVNLSISGLPGGVTASFNPSSTATTSTLTLTASGTSTVGGFLATVTGTSGSLTHTNRIIVNVVNTSVNVNLGFELPGIGTGNYQYNPVGAYWTFSGSPGNGSGLIANSSGFSNPNAPQGVQAAFVQSNGVISQVLSGFTPGTTYTITVAAAQRPGQDQHGGESWNMMIDNTTIKTNNPGGTSYADSSASFVASAGTHKLSLVGTDLATGDNTVFLDNVRISPALQPVAPEVALTSPTNNNSFIAAKTINLAANVTSNANFINGVQFYSDATTLIGQVTNVPYTCAWTNASAGNYNVFARVIFDDNGATDSVPVSIAVINTNVNFSFETPVIGSGNFQYDPINAFWTFNGASGSGSGLIANGSGFSNPNAPQGVQAAFVQGYGIISQKLAGFAVGTNYTITYSAAQRSGDNQHGGESWNVMIDNTVIKSNNPGSTSYTTYTATFTASASVHTLSFVGTDLATGDNTVFLDNVSFNPPISQLSPSVALTSPADHAVFSAANPINLTANVITNGNIINGVGFYANSNLIAQVASPYVYAWSNAPAGQSMVFARLVFNGANTVDTSAVNISVTNPPPVAMGIGFGVDGFNLNLQGIGLPNRPYYLNVASNLVPPVIWTPLLTNQSDASGNILFTNLAPTNAQEFFRLSAP